MARVSKDELPPPSTSMVIGDGGYLAALAALAVLTALSALSALPYPTTSSTTCRAWCPENPRRAR